MNYQSWPILAWSPTSPKCSYLLNAAVCRAGGPGSYAVSAFVRNGVGTGPRNSDCIHEVGGANWGQLGSMGYRIA